MVDRICCSPTAVLDGECAARSTAGAPVAHVCRERGSSKPGSTGCRCQGVTVLIRARLEI